MKNVFNFASRDDRVGGSKLRLCLLCLALLGGGVIYPYKQRMKAL